MTTLDLVKQEDLQQFKADLFAEMRKIGIGNSSQQPKKSWLKSADVRKLLNISPGTLQTLRINGTLRFTKMGSMFYYKQEDIERILESNLSTNP